MNDENSVGLAGRNEVGVLLSLLSCKRCSSSSVEGAKRNPFEFLNLLSGVPESKSSIKTMNRMPLAWNLVGDVFLAAKLGMSSASVLIIFYVVFIGSTYPLNLSALVIFSGHQRV